MALSTVITVIIGFLLATTTNAVTKKTKKASDPNDNKGNNVVMLAHVVHYFQVSSVKHLTLRSLLSQIKIEYK